MKTQETRPEAGDQCQCCVNQPAQFKNDIWTCDFIHDRTVDGRPLKWLTLVDEYTHECLVLHAATSIAGLEVRRIVARVTGQREAPTRIRSDNGSEFICEALVNWLPGVGTEPIPVAAGSPWENGYIESFHSRLRDEFLERVEFEDVADARAKASWYRENITRSGLTAHSATQHPKSSAQLATEGEFISEVIDMRLLAFKCSRQSPLWGGPKNGEQPTPQQSPILRPGHLRFLFPHSSHATTNPLRRATALRSRASLSLRSRSAKMISSRPASLSASVR
jgi:transposase InsO family protein